MREPRLDLPLDRRLPLRARVPLDLPDREAILGAHEAAIAAGEAGYVDPRSGLFVMTAQHHWSRGSCCDSGCRHCPYADGPR